MAWYTRSGALTHPAKRPVLRRVAAATAAGLVLTMAQTPAGAASEPDDTATAAAVEQPVDEVFHAAAKARQTGEPVELVSRRGASDTYWINPDGTTTVQTTPFPTRVKLDGEYVDIDPSLHKEGGLLTTEATKADVAVSPEGSVAGDAPLAEISRGSKSLALDWSSDLPAAEVDGAVATFDAGSKDVEVRATNYGFNVNVLLGHAPSSAPVYRLPVTAKGVRLAEDAVAGGYVATDGTGKVVFRIAPTVMYDATEAQREGGPENTVPVDSRLVEDGHGGQVLELRPSMEWLSDSSRVYPVRVDPDVYDDLAMARDTYVREQNDPATNYGTSAHLRVGYDATYKRQRAYVQHTLPQALIDRQGGAITKATLSLYQWDANSCGATTMDIYPGKGSWAAGGLTWNNNTTVTPTTSDTAQLDLKVTQPAFVHGYDGTCPAGSTATVNGTEVVDVTKIVQAWVDNAVPGGPTGIPNYGLVLRANETDTNALKVFCSGNWDTGTSTVCNQEARQPTLNVTYNTPPSSVYGMTESPATCPDGGIPIVTSTQPTLTGASADTLDNEGPDAVGGTSMQDQTRIHFEVWPYDAVEFDDIDAPGTADTAEMTVAGNTAYATQGTVQSWQVPANTLVDGQSYAWRARGYDRGDYSQYSYWQPFQVDTTAQPGSSCLVDVLPMVVASQASGILTTLADSQPSIYGGAYADELGRLYLTYKTGASSQSAAKAAGDAALASGLAANDVAGAKAALTVSAVPYSDTDLQVVTNDLAARNLVDPTLSRLAGWGIHIPSGKVDIGIENLTTEDTAALTATYGDKIITHEQSKTAAQASTDNRYNDPNPAYRGGARIWNDRQTGQIDTICSAGVAVENDHSAYMLTAGHCNTNGQHEYSTAGVWCNPDVPLNAYPNEACTSEKQVRATDMGTMLQGPSYNQTKGGRDVGMFTKSGGTFIPPGSTTPVSMFARQMWRGGRSTSTAYYKVGGAAKSKEAYGGVVCFSGAVSGNKCNLKIDTKYKNNCINVTVDLENKTYQRCDIFKLKEINFTPSRISWEGDSGAPVYSIIKDRNSDYYGMAYIHGLLLGAGTEYGTGDKFITMQRIDAAVAEMGVHVCTYATGNCGP